MGRMLVQKLAEEADIQEFFLPRDLNHFCLGCFGCIEEETRCPYWNEKKKILDSMEKADVFIFTTPNYCLAPSGAMKSFLDLFFDLWMVHRPKEWMFQKRAIVLSASAGASCKKVMGTVKDSLLYWGVPSIQAYGLPVQATSWDTIKPEKKAKIESVLTKLASKISVDTPPRVGFKTKFLFNMMRMMHVKGWDSSPVEKQYWEAHGWLGKARPWKNAKA